LKSAALDALSNLRLTSYMLSGKHGAQMAASLIETLCKGGCYWKHERADSPGHSVVIPGETPFRIAIEGPQSHRFVAGTCRDGYFLMEEGGHAGTKFSSANEAVNAVREPSSNAFLYTHLRIGDNWVSADDFRRSDHSWLDEAEELALEDAIRAVRNHPKAKALEHVKVIKLAAQHVAKNPQMIVSARQHLEAIAVIDLSEFDL
jgi:hypothetical protein